MYVHVYPNPPPGTRFAAIQTYLDELGEPPYRAQQAFRAICEGGLTRYTEMAELPRPLRSALTQRFGPSICDLRPVAVQTADYVEKALFESVRGDRVETVLTRYRAGWTSLCVSSQVGCGLGCSFCATGTVGLRRNLTADEICDQALHFRRAGRIDSVAFMGMGEALANPHVFPAIGALTHPRLFAISPRRISVSTVGFLPGLRRLVSEHPQVTVTLSVHSPYPDQRGELIPLSMRYPLDECLSVIDRHVAMTRRKAYLAYLLLDRVTDTDGHAEELARLVRDAARPDLLHVSVIPYNEAAGVPATYGRPSQVRVARFLRLLRARGVRATRRRQVGNRIDAACGQLHAKYAGSDEIRASRHA